MAHAANDVAGIVESVLRHRAAQRQIPLGRREITVRKFRNDYRVNRHEIFISIDYALIGNPFKMVDPVLDVVLEFDTREYRKRAEYIVRVKSEIMKQAAYLERTLNVSDYGEFMGSLLPIIQDVSYYAPDSEASDL